MGTSGCTEKRIVDHIGARFMNFLSFELQITLYVSKSAVAALKQQQQQQQMPRDTILAAGRIKE